jgi:hypothetical protein
MTTIRGFTMAAEGFVVHPEALTGYSGLVQRNAGYLVGMGTYLNNQAGSSEGLEGLMYPLKAITVRLASWQRDILSEMNRKLADTGSGLRSTANGYANTDTKAAAELDKTMPYSDDGQNPGRGAI